MVHAYRASSNEEVESIIMLFEEVARQERWQPGDGLRVYRDRSVYFGLWRGTTVEGGLQLVLPDAIGSLPFQTVWPEIVNAGGLRSAHIAVMAVRRTTRGVRGYESDTEVCANDRAAPFSFWLLATEMWRHCVLSGVGELWLEATPRTLRCYQRLGWPLQVRGELRTHWGEPCFPCSLDVCQVAGELAQRAVRSPAYRSVVLRATATAGEELRRTVIPT